MNGLSYGADIIQILSPCLRIMKHSHRMTYCGNCREMLLTGADYTIVTWQHARQVDVMQCSNK